MFNWDITAPPKLPPPPGVVGPWLRPRWRWDKSLPWLLLDSLWPPTESLSDKTIHKLRMLDKYSMDSEDLSSCRSTKRRLKLRDCDFLLTDQSSDFSWREIWQTTETRLEFFCKGFHQVLIRPDHSFKLNWVTLAIHLTWYFIRSRVPAIQSDYSLYYSAILDSCHLRFISSDCLVIFAESQDLGCRGLNFIN